MFHEWIWLYVGLVAVHAISSKGMKSSTSDVLAVSQVRTWCRTGVAREIREAANVSASEIARHLKVSEPTVSRWERGVRTPRAEEAARYHQLLCLLRQAAVGAATS